MQCSYAIAIITTLGGTSYVFGTVLPKHFWLFKQMWSRGRKSHRSVYLTGFDAWGSPLCTHENVHIASNKHIQGRQCQLPPKDPKSDLPKELWNRICNVLQKYPFLGQVLKHVVYQVAFGASFFFSSFLETSATSGSWPPRSSLRCLERLLRN